jgi:UDP-2,3-diacylglucosamine hydrolase
LFLADLHLDGQRPERIADFEAFCERANGRVAAVYILGDLFDVWIGDDDDGAVGARVAAALTQLSSATPVRFMPGNRDFLIGPDFLGRTRMRALDEPALIELFGQRTLLCHGDTLCTADHAYQALRRQLRDPVWQAQFLAQPLSERRQVAASLRADSGQATATKDDASMDVTDAALRDIVTAHAPELIIHGHTHRPAHHVHHFDGTSVVRWVLSDWLNQGGVLVADADGIRPQAPERV